MKTILLAATAIVAVAAGQASATELGGGTLSYNIGVTSDYVFRGVTQTDGDAAIQGGLDYSKSLFYAGAWASNVDFADYELDLYAGVKPSIGATSFDIGVVTYQYGDKAFNTTEAKVGVSHPLGKGTVGAAVYNNLDYGSTWYYELNGSYPITDKLSVSGAVGEQDFAGIKYSTGNIGLTYAITPNISIDGRFSDTNIPDWIKPSKERFAVSLKAAF